jgi:hypothetical protein
MKSSGTSYLLWLGSLFGVAGLHRFYLGRPVTGALWLFTLFPLVAVSNDFVYGPVVRSQLTRASRKSRGASLNNSVKF